MRRALIHILIVFVSLSAATARADDTRWSTLTEDGLYSISIQPQSGRIPIAERHDWVVSIRERDGKAVQPEQLAYLALAAVPDEPLSLDPITTTASVTGSQITLDAFASGGTNLEFNWSFGDGAAETGFWNFPSVNHSYASPGRYVISLTVRDLDSNEEIIYQFIQLVHWPLTASHAVSNSTPGKASKSCVRRAE